MTRLSQWSVAVGFFVSVSLNGFTEGKDAAYFEPFYQTGSGEMTQTYTGFTDGTTNGEYKYDLSGSMFGARLGYEKMGFILGIDLRAGSLDYDYKDPDGNLLLSSDYTVGLYSAFAMYRGSKFSPWIGFILDGSFVGDETTFDLDDPSGIYIGFGYKVLGFLQLYVEYMGFSFSKISTSTSELVLPTENQSEFDGSLLQFGISIPIEWTK